MLMFKDVVDLIISREFVLQRGQTEGAITYSDTDVRKFSSYSHSDRAKLGLTTTTSTNAPVTDFIQMASTLLSQGMPIIYYATEIGITNLNLVQVPKTIYPKDKSYNNDGKHQSLRSHLPMPWDLNGKRFSTAINDAIFTDYLNLYGNVSVVETELAERNNQSNIRLIQKLVALRQKPSMKWGKMERIRLNGASEQLIEAFARNAKGFPKFIVLLLKTAENNYLLDLSTICSSVTPRIIHPSSPNFPVDITLSHSRINMSMEIKQRRIFVFECD
ncbi:unnamed protein product [Schistosoma turkestanicum]|nr:unnamed protein product [Schistosoma turkestanicum]